jgi:hypothetical protein
MSLADAVAAKVADRVADKLADRLMAGHAESRAVLAKMSESIAKLADAQGVVFAQLQATQQAMAAASQGPARAMQPQAGGRDGGGEVRPAPAPDQPPAVKQARSLGRYCGRDNAGKCWWADDPDEVAYAVEFANRRLAGIPRGQGMSVRYASLAARKVGGTTDSVPSVSTTVTTYAVPTCTAPMPMGGGFGAPMGFGGGFGGGFMMGGGTCSVAGGG